MNIIKEQIIIEKLNFLKDKWNYNELSYNIYLPFKYVIDNPELSWNFNKLSYNSNITFEILYIILKYLGIIIN
jgi:hypothetical protein